MAILTPSQLQAASNATYFDNTSGSITPTAVRTLNDNWISSSILASVTSSMTVASASFASTASFSLNLNPTATASYAINASTASFALNFNPSATASYALFALTASNAISSSYAFQATNATTATNADTATFASTANTANSAVTAVTASNATTAVNASFATTASFALNFNPAATASYALNAATASYAIFAITASFLSGSATSASYAISASFANNANTATTAQTASYILNAVSASRAISAALADTATTAVNATSASYASNAELLDNLNFTAFVLTSSFVPFSGSIAGRVTTLETAGYATLGGNNTFTGNNIFGNITASNALVLSASIEYLFVQYETASVIYSSGSNQFGDAANDTQTLWGTVDVVTGPLLVTGSARVTGSLTMVGLSPVSVSHIKANDVQGVEILTNSNATVATFGAGGGTGVTVVGQVNATTFSGSGASIFGIVSSSYAITASSAVTALTASYVLNAVSSSFATTAGSVTALNQSLTITGSVNGNVISASIASNTSSIDFSQGNFYTSLVTGTTNFNITNPKAGQTLNLLLTTAGTGASASFSSNVKQVSGSVYAPTATAGAQDILTFISWDGTSVYLANVKNLI
jgi:hypothetical protein